MAFSGREKNSLLVSAPPGKRRKISPAEITEAVGWHGSGGGAEEVCVKRLRQVPQARKSQPRTGKASAANEKALNLW